MTAQVPILVLAMLVSGSANSLLVSHTHLVIVGEYHDAPKG